MLGGVGRAVSNDRPYPISSVIGLQLYVTEATDDCPASVASNEGRRNFCSLVRLRVSFAHIFCDHDDRAELVAIGF